jgi:hypothetical protein
MGGAHAPQVLRLVADADVLDASKSAPQLSSVVPYVTRSFLVSLELTTILSGF